MIVVGLVVGWVVGWLLGQLVGGLDGPWWLRLGLPIGPLLGALAALRVRARQTEQANLETLDR